MCDGKINNYFPVKNSIGCGSPQNIIGLLDEDGHSDGRHRVGGVEVYFELRMRSVQSLDFFTSPCRLYQNSNSGSSHKMSSSKSWEFNQESAFVHSLLSHLARFFLLAEEHDGRYR